MKIIKSAIAIILSIIIATSSAAIAGAVAKKEAKTVTVSQYAQTMVKIKSDASFFYTKVKGTNKAVRAEYESYENGKATFSIQGLKLTGKKPATVQLLGDNRKTGKKEVLKTIKVNVKKPAEKKFRAIKLSVGKNLIGTLNRRNFIRFYKLKIKDTSIAKCTDASMGFYDNVASLKFDTYKAGTTEADVYVKKTKVGTVAIKVGDYKPYLNTKDNSLTLKYNKHGNCEYFYGVEDYLVNYNADRYEHLTYKTDSEYITYNKNSVFPFITKKTGETTLTVLDGKKEVGTFKVNIVEGKMADVYRSNTGGDSDSDFLNYDTTLCTTSGDMTYNIFRHINTIVLNNKFKGTSFKKSDYKITYSTKDKKYISVSKKGVVTAKKAVDGRSVTIFYKIKFADESTYRGEFSIHLC